MNWLRWLSERPALAGLDLRLFPAAVGAWLAGLFSTQSSAGWGLLAGVGLLTVATGLSVAEVRRRLHPRAVPGSSLRVRMSLLAAVSALICAAGVDLGGAWRVHTLTVGPVVTLAAEHAVGTAELVLTADPVRRKPVVSGNARAPDGLVIRARLERLDARGRQVDLRVPVLALVPSSGWFGLLPSQRVRCVVRLAPASPGDSVAAVVVARGAPELLGGPSPPQRVAGRMRAGLRSAVSGLAADERGLVPGLVVGDTTEEPADLTTAFQSAGMTHLTAVSGSNVAFVLAALLLLARWAGVRGRAIGWCAAGGLGAFVILVRPEPSVLRAAFMGLISLVALTRGARGNGDPSAPGRGVPALLGCTVVLLLIDPFLSRAAGFALSVLAAAGLLVLAPGWRDRLERWLPAALADAIAVPCAAQAAVAPVLILLSPSVSLVAIPANILAGIAVAPATVLGVAAAVAAPVAPTIAVLLAHLAAVPATWIVWVARVGSSLPYGRVSWPAGVAGAGLLAGSMLVAPSAVRLARRRPRSALSLASALAALWFLPVPGQLGWPPPGWLVVACSVGQGDALVVGAGRGQAVVIDAGPDPAAIDRCLRDLGIHRIPLVVLTHFHADHVEGLPGLLRGRQVDEVEVSPLAEPPDEAARVANWAAEARIPVTVAGVGERRTFGDLSWTVLWPRRLIRVGGSAPNNASIVLSLTSHGVVFLLTGDVEPEAQEALLADPASLVADVFKVPHHGSRNQDPALVRAVHPRLGLVSVGVGNRYGHPAESTLALVRSSGAQVDRTDTDGDLAVVGPRDSLRLVARGPP